LPCIEPSIHTGIKFTTPEAFPEIQIFDRTRFVLRAKKAMMLPRYLFDVVAENLQKILIRS
jgi:hypothetical protein